MRLQAGNGPERNAWAIVLAGGDGSRLQPFVQDWLGEPRPKQFCRFLGPRTVLTEAVERTARLVDPERIIVVVGPGQRRWIDDLPDGPRVLEQPADRGTGAAVFLGLSHVLAEGRDDVALVLPADQFVFPEARFVAAARRALELATEHDDLVHLGAEARGPEGDQAWLRPGQRLNGAGSTPLVRQVLEMTRDPEREQADYFLQAGYLWATRVIAGRVRTLWNHGVREVPRLYRFGAIRNVLHSVHADRVPEQQARKATDHVYDFLEPVDVIADVLQPLARRSVTIPLEGVLWSNWSEPERIARNAAWIGKWPELAARLPSGVVEQHLHIRGMESRPRSMTQRGDRRRGVGSPQISRRPSTAEEAP